MDPVTAIAAFTVAAALLTVTPGLDTALVLRAAAVDGARPAFGAGGTANTPEPMCEMYSFNRSEDPSLRCSRMKCSGSFCATASARRCAKPCWTRPRARTC